VCGISFCSARSSLRPWRFLAHFALCQPEISRNLLCVNRQHDMAVLNDKIGDVQTVKGNLAPAMTSYRDSLAIVDHLTRTDADNSGWRADLSLAYLKVSDIQVAQGDPAGAASSVQNSIGILETLTKFGTGGQATSRGRFSADRVTPTGRVFHLENGPTPGLKS
jgi:hypothetical protein